jgi:hypothetical protein
MEAAGNIETVGIIIMLFMGLGMLFGIIGGLWLLVLAFQESIMWGIACFLLPGAALVFAVMHWGSSAQEAFMLQVVSIMLVGTAIFFMVSVGSTLPMPEAFAGSLALV